MTPRHDRDPAAKYLYIFDLDGTLIRSFLREGAPRGDFDLVEVLPGRLDVLRELRADGAHIAYATNQGGVAFGYQTKEQVVQKMDRVREALECGPDELLMVAYGHPFGRVPFYTYDDRRRKPHPGMILEAMRFWGVDAYHTTMVGDRPSDRMAANHAGVRYRDVSEFFEETPD